ncbi:hypothetical protein E4T44_06608 [Aureobasidium sp. EXF-8845]|nr:hypothetical protein E4T44_06608 [Aureobasidium sp. EXF-8845]
MSFRIPETRFLRVSTAAVRASREPTRRKVKENLGIVAGQELPRRGRCTHYAKSYRWFRYTRLFKDIYVWTMLTANAGSHAAAKFIPAM